MCRFFPPWGVLSETGRQAGSGPILHLDVKIPTGRIKRINWMLPSVRKEGKNKFFPPSTSFMRLSVCTCLGWLVICA